MASSFPVAQMTLSVNPNGASVQVTGLTRGVIYRVVAEAACYLQINGTAALGAGMYIPPNFPEQFTFGRVDSTATDPKVFVFIAAGTTKVYFTPIVPVSIG
jgi:hypothetical protein